MANVPKTPEEFERLASELARLKAIVASVERYAHDLQTDWLVSTSESGINKHVADELTKLLNPESAT